MRTRIIKETLISWILPLAVLFTLAGCGLPTQTEKEANQSPTANAGSDQKATIAMTVTLDGRGSSDPDNDALTYTWSQIRGGSVTLSDKKAVEPTFTAPNKSDTLVFSLIVSDNIEASASDSVIVAVASTDKVISFKDDLEPLFSDPCTTCHGSAGGYSLESYSDVLGNGSDGVPNVIPLDIDSLLIKKLEGTGPGARMPKNSSPWDETRIQLVKDWIIQGAENN